MKPETVVNPNSAAEIAALDAQNRVNTLTSLKQNSDPYNQLRIDRKISALTPSTSITSTDLKSTNGITSLPDTSLDTTVSGLSGLSDGSLNSYQSNIDKTLNQTVTDTSANASASKQSLFDSVKQYLGVYSNPDVLKAQEGTAIAETLNNDAFNALQASKRAQDKELKSLEGSGLGQFQIAQKAQEINRRYAFDQADLSIALDVSNRNYTAAQNKANSLIQSKLEPLKMLIDFQKTIYEDDKQALNTAEQNKLKQLMTENERQYDAQKTALKTLTDTKLELLKNAKELNAPNSIINAISTSKTPEEAITSAGSYGGKSKNTSTQYYTEATAPVTLKKEIIANIKGGATPQQIYNAYPDVSSDYLDKLMGNIVSDTSTTNKDTSSVQWWNPFSW